MLVFYTPIFGVLMKMFMGGQIFGAGVIIVSFFLLILCGMVCGTDSDIFCLKSVKRTLDDPYNYLQSWNFNNNTEGYICKFTGVECWHPDENKVLNLKPQTKLKRQQLFPPFRTKFTVYTKNHRTYIKKKKN